MWLTKTNMTLCIYLSKCAAVFLITPFLTLSCRIGLKVPFAETLMWNKSTDYLCLFCTTMNTVNIECMYECFAVMQ